MSNISRILSAFPSGRTWEKDKHFADGHLRVRVPLIDPSGQPLPGIQGSHGVRGLKPDGSYLGCDLIWLRPHSGFPLHTHDGDHILYILEGQGFVHIGGKEIAVRATDFIYIPAELPHRVWTAESPLIIVATGHPHKEIDTSDRMALA